MPWSAKAQDVLRTQYAAVGAAGWAALPRVVEALDQASGRVEALEREPSTAVQSSFRHRDQDLARVVAAFRPYCWPVHSLADLKLAPFHLLASEGAVYTHRDHRWNIDTDSCYYNADFKLFRPTRLSLWT